MPLTKEVVMILSLPLPFASTIVTPLTPRALSALSTLGNFALLTMASICFMPAPDIM